eukprot:scaffold591_cov69-Skeletonema_dohrnii-CCMP3373.AAC.4
MEAGSKEYDCSFDRIHSCTARQYNAMEMEAMSTSLSNLQQIVLQSLDYTRKITSTTMERTDMKTKLSALGLLWHLDDLATSSVLKELHCKGTPVKGNIKCLRV